MAGRVEKWQSRRKERREERLEEMARRLAAGGRPVVAGGLVLKLVALGVLVAFGVLFYLIINSWLDGFSESTSTAHFVVISLSKGCRLASPLWVSRASIRSG